MNDDARPLSEIHPVACEELATGLRFTFSDGSEKFYPNFTPPYGALRFERKEDKQKLT